MQSAKALGIAGLCSALSTFWNEGLALIKPWLASYQLSHWFERLSAVTLGPAWMGRTVTFVWEPIFIAAGAITGIRVCTSMFIGGILCWMVYVPIMQQQGVITGSGYKDLVQWTLWGGAACMVTSGLLSFGLQWRSALRAFTSLGRLVMPKARHKSDLLERIETPPSWFLGGQLIGTVGLAYLAQTTFGMPYWLTVFAVLLSFALALVACRVCGETIQRRSAQWVRSHSSPSEPSGRAT